MINYKTITSSTNPLLKKIKTLHKKKGRQEHNIFIAEGVRTVSTLIQNGLQAQDLLCTHSLRETAENLQEDNITVISPELMENISASTTPSGILGVFEIPTPDTATISEGIVCAEISDPGNLGTLLRSCAAMGKKTVIVVGGADPFAPKVVQSAAGAHALVDIFQLRWEQVIKYKNDIKLSALIVKDGAQPTKEIMQNCLFVIGNEAHGIRPQWIEQCDQAITLPMPGHTESLNAAVAGSLALYFSIIT